MANSIYGFHTSVLNEVINLDKWKQVMFMACCCERGIGNYENFFEKTKWGNPKTLITALDVVWDELESGNFNVEVLEVQLKKVEEIVPDTEDFKTALTSYALDSASAIWSLLKFLIDGEKKLMIEVIEFPINTTAYFIDNQEGHSFHVRDASRGMGEKISGHPLVIRELEREKRDLIFIGGLKEKNEKSIELMKRRSREEKLFE